MKKTGSLLVPIQLMVALIGMGLVIITRIKPSMIIMMGQLVLLSVEMDTLSWTSETVIKQELFMLH